MASSSRNSSISSTSLPKVATYEKSIVKNGHSFAPEPDASKSEIWESQVLLPFTIDGMDSAFIGPLISPTAAAKIRHFFPGHSQRKSIAFQNSIPVGYFDQNNRLFRNPPKVNIEGYRTWLDRVEAEKMSTWKKISIYDLIQLSKNSYTVNPGLMGGALYFWDKTTHTFHTPYGMITPTLLDVAVITGLPPLGEEILITTKSTTGIKYSINLSSTTYQSFIHNNRGKDKDPVSDNEHITFLLYWLSGIIFCARSIQVEVIYLPLAIMLAEGRKLCMANLFLARLYLPLDWITDLMRDNKRITNVDGPIWFFQLWLSAIFKSELQERRDGKNPTGSVVAGHHLLNLIFPDKLKAPHEKMKHFFQAFCNLSEKNNTVNLAPFTNRQVGPEWLTQTLSLATVT